MNSKLQKKVSGDIGNLANNCLGSGNFIANSTIYQHEIIVHVDENIVSPFNNSNGVTTPTKTILTEIEFNPFEQIYYYDSTVTVSTSSFVNANSLYYTMDSLDLRYSFNIESPLEVNKNVYLKTNLQFGQKVKLDADTPLVQELEDATDEVWYILIGRAIDDYHISLYFDKKIFHSDGSEVVFHDHDDRYYTQPEVDSKVTPMYGYCETAAETVAKTVTISNFTLITGRTIFIKFKYANTASNPTLNVNRTGAKRIYRWGTTSAGTTAATNGWQANSVVALTYDGTGWIEHLWQNNQYNLANNSLGNGSFTADSAVYRYQLLVHVDKETLSPFNNDNNVSGTTKTILTNLEFDPFGQIYYYDSTTTVNAGDLISGGALYYSRSGTDMRYSFNISASVSPLTAHKYVYMKVIPLANGKVKLASAMPLVQELPTTNDGYWYISLGRASGDYALAIYPEKPVFYHDGTQIRQKFNPYMEYALNENAIQGTTSGSIVSFDDGIAQPVVDLTVGIESVQDLHGYDKPWPAGGGKNLLPLTVENLKTLNTNGVWSGKEYTYRGITFVINTDTDNNVSNIVVKGGTSTGQIWFYLTPDNYDIPEGSYYFSGCPSGGSTGTFMITIKIANSGNTGYQADTGNGTNIVFTNTYTHVRTYIEIKNNTTIGANGITYKPMLEVGNAATSFAPYSNVCPISGWTGANVFRSGKNILPKLLSTEEINETRYSLVSDGDSITLNGTINNSGMISNNLSDYFFIKAGTYILSANNLTAIPKLSSDAYADLRLIINGASPTEYRLELSNVNTSRQMVFSTDLYVLLRLRVYNGLTFDNVIIKPTLCLVPETNTTFESSQRTEYPISWSTEAGMVYGGSLDVTTGLLTVDWRSVTLTGAEEEGWTISNSGAENWYYRSKNNILIDSLDNSTSLLSNLYPYGSVLVGTTDKGIWNSGSSNHIRVRWGTEDTIENWKNFLASNPLHVIYKTLEPLTYQLTPTEVTTLLGSNRIWADTGNVDVTYVRNTNNGKIITNINNNIKSILNWFGLTYYNNGIYVNPDQGV